MRTWRRVEWLSTCGACGAVLGRGMLMQTLELPMVKRRLVRCEDCAEGAAPPDLPLVQEPGQSTKRMPAISRIAKTVTREYLPYKQT